MKQIFITACLLMICLWAPKAQIYHLSLEESIEIAKKQNFDIQNLLQSNIIAENQLKAAIARLRTRVDMNLGLPQFTETVREWEDSTGISFFSIKTLRESVNLSVSQPLPTDGSVYISSGLSSVNDYNTDKRASQFSTRIGLSQPLNSFWGYNAIRSQLKTAQLNYERTNKALKRAELDVVYIVSRDYYELLQLQKSMEIAQMNLERQTEVYELTKNKYEAGLIREVEALQMEVDLAETQNEYDMSSLLLHSANQSFIKLLGLELEASVTIKSETDHYNIVSIDPEKAVEMAIANRMEIKDAEIAIALQKLQISYQKSQGLPIASLNASWERVGISNLVSSDSYSNSASSTWNDLKARPANYMVGLNIQIPIIDWGRNKKLVRVEEARQKQNVLGKENQEREIEVEVRNLVSNVQTTLSRLQLLEKNVSVAEKSFDITLKRYTDGDIDSQGLALDRNRLNSAQLRHLTAFVSYRLLLADLMRKTFYDFEKDIPIE